jgi:hypothetical protein
VNVKIKKLKPKLDQLLIVFLFCNIIEKHFHFISALLLKAHENVFKIR